MKICLVHCGHLWQRNRDSRASGLSEAKSESGEVGEVSHWFMRNYTEVIPFSLSTVLTVLRLILNGSFFGGQERPKQEEAKKE
jgi:hypothetical protein